MAQYARKLRYAGAPNENGGTGYIALLEFARKKGGRPTGFVLYRYSIDWTTLPVKKQAKMIRLSGAITTEEAIRRFWPGSRLLGWEKTTLWLVHVAMGGGYERFGYENDLKEIRFGDWVKIGRPAPRSKRRTRKKKKPLEIGNLGHILLAHRKRHQALLNEKSSLTQALISLEEYDEKTDSQFVPDDKQIEFDKLSVEVARIENEEIPPVLADIARIEAEMKYKARRMFPKQVA